MKKSFALSLIVSVLCITIYPLLWMFLSSFKTNREIYKPSLLFPAKFDWYAFQNLFDSSYLPFVEIFSNSLILSVSQAILATLVSAGAGYCLAVYKFRINSLVLGLALIIILVPKQTLAVPIFDWLSWLGWRGNLISLLLPGAVSGLGVLFFYQIFRQFPNEWIELARMEGLSPSKTFTLLIPLVFPGVVTFFFLHFVLSFQEHLLPLLLLDDQSMTLPMALAKLKDSSHRIPEAVGMAASTLSTKLAKMVLMVVKSFSKPWIASFGAT